MDKTKPPGIIIENIFLEECLFKKKNEDIDLSIKYTVNININKRYDILEGGKRGRTKLTAEVTEPSGLFFIKLGYMLYAAVEQGKENMALEEYLNQNAPPTLWQMMRETLFSMTQKAGIPFILPPFNFNLPTIESEGQLDTMKVD